MRYKRLCTAATAVLTVTGCAGEAMISGTGSAAAPGGAAGSAQALSLADVAVLCAEPQQSGPGVAIVTTELRDANRTIELPDCVVHLEQGADVTLNNVTITGGVINIHDRDTDPSTNRMKLQRVTVDNAALLVELNDADDSFEAEATSITTQHGIGLRVAGTHDGANDGGSISMVGSALLATDLDATIHVLASEHSGTVRLHNTTVDTRGPLTVLAATCSAQLGGDRLDCSTATVSAELDG
jgi:hypothetical protein